MEMRSRIGVARGRDQDEEEDEAGLQAHARVLGGMEEPEGQEGAPGGRRVLEISLLEANLLERPGGAEEEVEMRSRLSRKRHEGTDAAEAEESEYTESNKRRHVRDGEQDFKRLCLEEWKVDEVPADDLGRVKMVVELAQEGQNVIPQLQGGG